MKAMVLAAGAGTRLRPLTDSVPKPLAPIANVALLFRTFGWLAGQGVTDVMLNAGHMAGKIVGAVGDGASFGLRASVSVEETLLGTSGAVKRCEDFFKDGPFMVIYGDNLIDADLGPLIEFHRRRKSEATIALFTPGDISSCGAVETDEGGRVQRFVEKPKPGETDSKRANAGVYIIEPHLLRTLPSGFSDFGADIFPAWVADGRQVYARDLGGYLQDTGTPERYRKANWDVLGARLKQSPAGERIGGSWIGAGCEIAPGASLTGKNCIGARVKIGPGSRLENCIVWEDATVGDDCELTDVIVGQGAVVGNGAQLCAAIAA